MLLKIFSNKIYFNKTSINNYLVFPAIINVCNECSALTMYLFKK